MGRPQLRFGVSSMVVLLLWSMWTMPASAHWADQAVAEIMVGDTQARLTLTFPTGLTASVDDNRDGQISPDEVRAHRAELAKFLGERIRLSDGRESGILTVEPAEGATLPSNLNLAPSTHSTLLLLYRWPRSLNSMTIQYHLFPPGVPTASCLATILQGGQVRNVVFTPEHREVSFRFDRMSIATQLASFIVLGIRHILTGYDHVLFLLSLLMLGGTLRQLVKVVTAFTVAHSITLSLATLNVVALPARWVESAIALSILYVAAENLWRKDITLRQRWLVTCGFGLVHGLGFASILQGLNLPRANVAVSLSGFNLGVEIGQIAIVTVAFLTMQVLRRWPWEVAVRRWVSAGAAAFGLIWFVQRAFLGG